ncbi:copper resistance protein [Dickeya fangzhongdai]|uniref:copper resistance protein n=1 Tax=Dickeya fangzhongdai TaxID=1778540 RepID=UPI001ADC5C98|nr:copper resistance protein [Dickeya fangzhongdai]MBO8133956.1 copper resistance protein [Dickeya fangzhongdai]
MRNRQLVGNLFLALACLIMLTCLIQRVASLQQLLANPISATASAFAPNEDPPAAITPCQLSAHSLLMVQPLRMEHIIPLLTLVFAAVAPRVKIRLTFPVAHLFFPPLLRIHLKHCVFRE